MSLDRLRESIQTGEISLRGRVTPAYKQKAEEFVVALREAFAPFRAFLIHVLGCSPDSIDEAHPFEGAYLALLKAAMRAKVHGVELSVEDLGRFGEECFETREVVVDEGFDPVHLADTSFINHDPDEWWGALYRRKRDCDVPGMLKTLNPENGGPRHGKRKKGEAPKVYSKGEILKKVAGSPDPEQAMQFYEDLIATLRNDAEFSWASRALIQTACLYRSEPREWLRYVRRRAQELQDTGEFPWATRTLFEQCVAGWEDPVARLRTLKNKADALERELLKDTRLRHIPSIYPRYVYAAIHYSDPKEWIVGKLRIEI